MTWLVLEVLMVVLERGVGVEERGSDEGGDGVWVYRGGGVPSEWGFYS